MLPISRWLGFAYFLAAPKWLLLRETTRAWRGLEISGGRRASELGKVRRKPLISFRNIEWIRRWSRLWERYGLVFTQRVTVQILWIRGILYARLIRGNLLTYLMIWIYGQAISRSNKVIHFWYHWRCKLRKNHYNYITIYLAFILKGELWFHMDPVYGVICRIHIFTANPIKLSRFDILKIQ